MAETYTKKSDLDEAVIGELTGGEYFDYYIGLSNKRLSLTVIKQFILGLVGGIARAIGTDVTGAIVTTTDSQTVSNKDLEDCKINSGDTLVVTSTELNHVAGVTANIADSISNIEGNIETNTAAIAEQAALLTEFETNINANAKMFSSVKSYSSETPIILSTEISADDNINHLGIVAKMYSVSGLNYTEVSTIGTIITSKSDGSGGYILDDITLPEVTGDYLIVIYYSIIS